MQNTYVSIILTFCLLPLRNVSTLSKPTATIVALIECWKWQEAMAHSSWLGSAHVLMPLSPSWAASWTAAPFRWNLTFKTGGVDGCDCEEVLSLIEQGEIDTTPLITHRFPLDQIEEAYRVFENKEDGVIKIAIK